MSGPSCLKHENLVSMQAFLSRLIFCAMLARPNSRFVLTQIASSIHDFVLSFSRYSSLFLVKYIYYKYFINPKLHVLAPNFRAIPQSSVTSEMSDDFKWLRIHREVM